MMLGLVITNFGNVVAEFAGIASSLGAVPHLRGTTASPLPPPSSGFWWSKAPTRAWRRFSWRRRSSTSPTSSPVCWPARVGRRRSWRPSSRRSAGPFHAPAYLYMVIAIIGTTIAPWMQFYLQSSIVEKGITPREYSASRWDVILGCFFTDVVAWFIVVACAATLLYTHGIRQIRGCRRRRAGTAPPGGRIRLHPVCRRTVQCVAVCGFDLADLDGLHGLRGPGLRVGSGTQVQRGQGFLLALHRAADRRRRE